MATLFGRQGGGSSRPILQFRAGRMTKSGKLVTPDKAKGIVSLTQSPTGAVEITWDCEDDRTRSETRTVVGDVKVSRVTKCTTGRVFVIDFGGDNQLFYWLQERSEERDEEYLKILKKHCERGGEQSGTAAPSRDNANNIQLSALQNILANLGPGGAAPATTASQRPAVVAPRPSTDVIDLQAVINAPEVLQALQADPAFFMARLHEHCPPGTDASGDIVEQVRNPQVSAAAGLLQAALSEPDGFREIATAFGVQPRAAQTPLGALEFLEMIDQEPKKDDKKDQE